MDRLFSSLPLRFARFLIPALIAAVSLPAAPARAAVDSEEDLVDYESIVKDLQTQAEYPANLGGKTRGRARMARVRSSEDPFADVMIHAGVGMSALVQSVSLPDGSATYLNQRGVQAALGIDLFSPNWMAEGTMRSFGESEDPNFRISLKEFELKVLYKKLFSSQLGIRAGGGLSGRYMTIRRVQDTLEYTTPSSVATVGLDLFLSDAMSFGFEVSGRQAMVGDTLDRASADGTLRLDTHF